MRINKVWLVYGANEGIGEATVKFLMQKGQQVVAINQSGEISNHSTNRLPDQRLLDIFSQPQIESTVEQILHQYGSIDWLINNGNSGLLNSHVLSVMQQAGHGHIIQLTDRKKYSGILAEYPLLEEGVERNKSDVGHLREDDFEVTESAKKPLPEDEATVSQDHGVRVTIIGPDTFYHSLLSLTTDNHL